MIKDRLISLKNKLPQDTKLVAVSKFHGADSIMEAYGQGQRIFGESRATELKSKAAILPKDIEWHFIGHLQSNKVNLVLPYACMVQSVDSIRILEAIDRWGESNGKTTDILLEYHVSKEESKFGFTDEEILNILENNSRYCHVRFCGLMAMATNTSDTDIIEDDFKKVLSLKTSINQKLKNLHDFKELSIGMSGDYEIALKYGATMVRIGSYIFGERR